MINTIKTSQKLVKEKVNFVRIEPSGRIGVKFIFSSSEQINSFIINHDLHNKLQAVVNAPKMLLQGTAIA